MHALTTATFQHPYTAKHKQLEDTYIHKNFSIALFFIQENHIIRSFPGKASQRGAVHTAACLLDKKSFLILLPNENRKLMSNRLGGVLGIQLPRLNLPPHPSIHDYSGLAAIYLLLGPSPPEGPCPGLVMMTVTICHTIFEWVC